MRALGNGGSLGLAAVEVENATKSTKVETSNKSPSGHEETVVGVTRGSDSSHRENLKDVHNHLCSKVFSEQIRIGTDCSGMEAPIQAIKKLEFGVHSSVQL